MQRDDPRNDDQKNTAEGRRIEPERSKEPPRQELEKTENARDRARPDAGDENVEPIVLPVVVVPVEQPQAGEIPAKTAPADVPTADPQQPSAEGDGPDQVPPGPEVLATEVRQLVGRLRPKREFELPLPLQADDGSVAEEDDMTMEEAIDHFVSLAEDKMRELNLGQQDSGARPIGTHRGSSAGDVERGILRHGDDRGAAMQLGDAGSGDEASALDPRISLSLPPAIPSGDAGPGDGGAPIPQLQIVVQMSDARTMYDEAIDEALKRKAPEYREIAESEVKFGFWQYENERRRVDSRLRA